MLLDQPGDEIRVADVADDEARLVGDGPVEAGRKIVEHDDRFARVKEGQCHVAADVASPACHQNADVSPFSVRPNAPSGRGVWSWVGVVSEQYS